ncbi:hypothetical protein D3C83_239410 [compost metagenome]
MSSSAADDTSSSIFFGHMTDASTEKKRSDAMVRREPTIGTLYHSVISIFAPTNSSTRARPILR